MKKPYSTPVVEKVSFDYKVHTSAAYTCFESVMNVREGTVISGQVPVGMCVSGNVIYIGWNNTQTGV